MSNIDWSKLITKQMKDTAALDMTKLEVQSHVAVLKNLADNAIQPLQDDHDTGDSTEEGKALLILWKRYRSALVKVPLQPGYPITIDWPIAPT